MTKMMSSIINNGIHHCKTELKEETFHCTWSIENFCNIFNFGVPLTYSIAEHNFTFSVCRNPDDITLLTFYGLISELKYPTIKCFYSIVCKTNEKTFDKKYGKCTMLQNKSTLLCDLYIGSLCDRGQLVSKGTFTIYFEFHILDELINSSINHLYKTPAMTYINTDILVSNEISKPLFVTFVVNQEQTLQANKNLLCLKSKVFKAMFDCDMKESKTNEIEITDITYNILKELLSFVQTGYLSKKIEEINLNEICELFIAADKYDIKDLKLICEQYIIKNITKENVVKYLRFAYLNNATAFTKYAKDFIKLYSKDIVNTPNFITLMQEYPELLTQIENINLTTYTYNLAV